MLGYIRFRNRYPNSQFEAEALSNIQSLQLSQNDGFTPIGEQYVVVRKSNIFAEPNSKADSLKVAKSGEVYEALRMTKNERWVELRVSRGQVGYIRAVRTEPYEDSVFQAWAMAEAEGTVFAYRAFRDAFPSSQFDDAAAAAIDDLLANANTIQPINESIVVPSRALVFLQPDTSGSAPGHPAREFRRGRNRYRAARRSSIGSTPPAVRVTFWLLKLCSISVQSAKPGIMPVVPIRLMP